jgi:hypothetical protein
MHHACKTALLAGLAAAALSATPAAAGDPLWTDIVQPYLQRLDGLSPDAGDASAVNTVTHMIDPWPRASGNRHIPGNGQRMSGAVERYRDVSKLPLAPQPIAPVEISASGFSTGSGGSTTSSTATTTSK